MAKRVVLIFLLCSPAITWAVFKPLRVVAPEWVDGISCVSREVCVEDLSRSQAAVALYQEAVDSVAMAVGPFDENPRVIFCSTMDCVRAFGFKAAAAISVGKSGIVISPRGWQGHYLRHEMIHYRQAEELGVVAQWRSPEWFKEGMAYALSNDPRERLAEPWQHYRSQFEGWYESMEADHFWEEARRL